MKYTLFEKLFLAFFIITSSVLILTILFNKNLLTLDLISTVFSFYMSLGIIISLILMIHNKEYRTLGISLIFPLYVIKYILKMEETMLKKLLAIHVMGVFVLFCIVNILKIIMTPQM